jgi:hypothetical protein
VHPERAPPTGPVETATIDPARVAWTDRVGAADLVIWTERLRIDRVAIFRVSAFRTFNAAVLIAPAAEDSAVLAAIASVAAVIDLAAAGLAGLAGSAAVAGSEVGANN